MTKKQKSQPLSPIAQVAYQHGALNPNKGIKTAVRVMKLVGGTDMDTLVAKKLLQTLENNKKHNS